MRVRSGNGAAFNFCSTRLSAFVQRSHFHMGRSEVVKRRCPTSNLERDQLEANASTDIMSYAQAASVNFPAFSYNLAGVTGPHKRL